MWELLPSDYCFGQEHHAQTVPLQFEHGRSFSSGKMDGREWMARGHYAHALLVRPHISARLKHRRLGAHTVQVKVRYSDVTTLTRQFSVEEPITEVSDIYRLGCFLLGRDKLVSRPLRLLGLGVSSLREPNGQQLVLL